MSNETLGYKIRKIRKSLGLSQTDFAVKLGFKHPTSVSKFEDNTRTPDKDRLMDIAKFGGISVDELLRDIAPLPPEQGNLETSAELGVESVDGIKISEDLFLATRVLESGTPYATALHLNIRSFAKAIDAEERISVLESNQRDFERKMLAEMSELRKEVNRLKSTYEAPSGGDGHLATEKQAM